MNFPRCWIIAILATVTTLFCSATADAQVSTNSFVRSYILSRPTVSPYLNLLRNDGVSGIANYQTLVRPQIQARELATLQQEENVRIERQIQTQQLSIEGLQQQRAQRVFSTGHQTRFMNYQNYFPGFGAIRGR